MIQRIRGRWPLIAAVVTTACAADPPPIPVDDVGAARDRLEAERAAVRADTGAGPAERARRMIVLGLWRDADSLLADAGTTPAAELARAELAVKRHRYREAAAHVDGVLAADPSNRRARLLGARLAVQAWDLAAAAATATALLDEDGRDEEAALLLGRVRLLEKRYDEALAWAERVRRWNRRNAGAYLLEADVRFWDQDPAGAEAPLVRAIELDPFDPDARFSYGYAIWRRVDATQLDAMAAQWSLALEIDPLHYVTHWHWGNGHTNLTYADYAHPTDSIVRVRLKPVHDRIARDEIPAAIEATREIEREFPESVLPALTRGSAFYMAYGIDRAARLDSAQATFLSILERKPHYGPAHNGLAAVIKQRQFTVLTSYDSLEAVIAATPLPADPVFDSVFSDVDRYPGDRVRRMARAQLGPSIAYVPLLHRLGLTFTIPPLHVDLAEAMDQPRLRTSTTFDNRQWMDIRGIGGGAAGIEYVERGSHWERNVLVHEYAHLYHGRVLTDAETRRIRDLYHQAMREGRTLDYYASNNEHEFFAQAYDAYISPVKVHPLNHKAMNTHEDLRRKDPATFAFVDSLVARQRAFIDGDSTVFRSNWAQVYTALSERALRGGAGVAANLPAGARQRVAAALLDTALIRDSTYLPAILGYAALRREQGRFDDAERWLARAEALASSYAPIYSARAELVGARAAAGSADTGADRIGDRPDPIADAGGRAVALDDGSPLAERLALLDKALDLERDLAERARLNATLRMLLADHARIPDAIRAAEEYATSAPTISTYLRDRRDEAAAFASELRRELGYAEATIPFFAEIVARKPQDYELRMHYADALAAVGRLDEAIDVVAEAQRILAAAGRARADYMVQIAGIHLQRGDTAAARETLAPVLDGRARIAEADPRLLRVLADLGELDELERRARRLDSGDTPRARAEADFIRGRIAALQADSATAERAFREALASNPYHLEARLRLLGLLARAGRSNDVDAVIAGADSLEIPLGPGFRQAADAVVAVPST